MKIELQSMKNFDPTTRWRVMQMGEPGAGKSVRSSKFPWPILFLDTDDKMSGLWDFWRKEGGAEFEDFENNVHHIPFREEDASEPHAIDDLYTVISKLQADATFGGMKFATIVVDSLTNVQTFMMNQVLKHRKPSDKTEAKRPFFIVDGRKKEVPVLPDYGVLVAHMQTFIIEMKAIPANVIINVHIKERQHRKTKIWYTGPLVIGDVLPFDLPTHFDEVHYLYTEPIEEDSEEFHYLAQTRSDGNIRFCRSSIRDIPMRIDQEYTTLLNLLQLGGRMTREEAIQAVHAQRGEKH